MSNEIMVRTESAELGLPSPPQMEALANFCRQMVGTPFLPKTLVQGKTPEQQSGTLLAVVLTGREMGLLPMFSLRAFWLSPDGRLGMYADSMLAIMRSKGVKFKWLRNENDGCKVQGIREDEEYTAEFTIQDAHAAGLSGKAVWKSYPKAMCRARCLGEIFRALCSDMGGTQMYSREELMDMDPGDSDVEGVHAAADRAAEDGGEYAIRPKAQAEVVTAEVVNAEVVQEKPKESTSRPPAPAPAPAAKPAPEPASDPHAAAKAEYMTLAKEIMALAPGLKKSDLTEWLNGWFSGEQRKPAPDRYAAALKVLVLVLTDYPQAASALVERPNKLGELMKQHAVTRGEEAFSDPEETSWMPPQDTPPGAPAADNDDPIPAPNSPIADEFQWSAKTCTLASDVMRGKAKVGTDPKAVITALKGLGFVGMDDADAYAMLSLYWYDTDAFILRKKGAAVGLGPVAILGKIEAKLGGKPLQDYKPTDLMVRSAFDAVMGEL